MIIKHKAAKMAYEFFSFPWMIVSHLTDLIMKWVLDIDSMETYNGVNIYFFNGVNEEDKKCSWLEMYISGFSSGTSIFLKSRDKGELATYKHEYGHCRQARMLGPLFLPVVGIASMILNVYSRYRTTKKNYYEYFQEKWADKLGGVKHTKEKVEENGMITEYFYRDGILTGIKVYSK